MTKAIIMSLLSVIMGLFSCNAQSNKFRSVDADTFAKEVSDTTVVRLDVRTPEEYAEGHIEKAINIDVLSQDFESKALSALPKDKTIALYCRSGNRSKRAANILADKGYKVIELSTGYRGWVSAKRKKNTDQ
jgi:rhodanese-related sulfurtransferase